MAPIPPSVAPIVRTSRQPGVVRRPVAVSEVECRPGDAVPRRRPQPRPLRVGHGVDELLTVVVTVRGGDAVVSESQRSMIIIN